MGRLSLSRSLFGVIDTRRFLRNNPEGIIKSIYARDRIKSVKHTSGYFRTYCGLARAEVNPDAVDWDMLVLSHSVLGLITGNHSGFSDRDYDLMSVGKGKPRSGSDVGSDAADFSTSITNRRGAGGRGSMSRYGVKYVQAMDRRYAPLTKEAMVRRYKRMDRDVDYLYKTGVINNLSPVTMTKEEVHNYLVYRMNLGVSDSEMDHEIAAMKSVFNYCGNKAMDEALAAYPNLKPKKYGGRRPTMPYELVDRIMECAMSVDPSDWRRMRGYAIPIWALATGMRAKELTLCDIDDINVTGTVWTAKVMHPKGEGSYGKPRMTIVDPQMCPFLLNYFKCRAEYVTDQGLITRALFPGGNSEGGYMQGNTIRNLKNIASEEVGGGLRPPHLQEDLRAAPDRCRSQHRSGQQAHGPQEHRDHRELLLLHEQRLRGRSGDGDVRQPRSPQRRVWRNDAEPAQRFPRIPLS